MTTQVGKNEVMRMISAGINNFSLGTDGTDVTNLETDLLGLEATTTKQPEVTLNGSTMNIRHSISTTEGNGITFREAGVYLNGILLDRVVYPDFIKTAQVELTTVEIFKVR